MSELSKEIAKRKYQMTEDRFWYIVEQINWAKLSQSKNKLDFEVARANVVSLFNFNYRVVKELRGIYYYAWVLLDRFIGQRNPARGSDDSHDDLLAHIIGLGRKEFYACLKDYERIAARGAAPYGTPEGYRESFAYILPSEADAPDNRKEYDVTIEAIVRKTIRIKADSEQEAIEEAHSLFTTVCEEGEPEHYEEVCVRVEDVKETA